MPPFLIIIAYLNVLSIFPSHTKSHISHSTFTFNQLAEANNLNAKLTSQAQLETAEALSWSESQEYHLFSVIILQALATDNY